MRKLTGFLFTVILLSSCFHPKQIEYRAVKDIKLNGFNLEQSELMMTLILFNPNHFSMTLRKLDCVLAVNKNQAGTLQLDTLLIIPANAAFMLPVQVKANMKSVLSNSIASLISNEILVSVNGTARAGKHGIYFNIPIHFETKQPLSLFN